MLKKPWIILIIVIFVVVLSLLISQSGFKNRAQYSENKFDVEFTKVSKDGTSLEVPKGYISTNRDGSFFSFGSNLIKGTGTNRLFEVALYKREVDKPLPDSSNGEYCSDISEKIASSRNGTINLSKIVTTNSGLKGCLTFIDFNVIGRSYSAYFPRENNYSLELGHVYSTTNTEGTEEDHKGLFNKIVESVNFE